VTGYYKIRALAFLLQISYFGTKEVLKRLIEQSLFLNRRLETPSREELKVHYEDLLYDEYVD